MTDALADVYHMWHKMPWGRSRRRGDALGEEEMGMGVVVDTQSSSNDRRLN